MNDSPNDPRLAALRRRWEAEPTPQVAGELAEAYRGAGRVQEGVEVLKAAVERQPGRLAPKVALGRFLSRIGHRAEAVESLEQVVETDPTHLVANKLLVSLHLDQGQLKQARDRLDLYSLLNASDPEIEQLEARLAEPPPAAPAGEAGLEEPPPLPSHVAAPEPGTAEPEPPTAEPEPPTAEPEPPPLPPRAPTGGESEQDRSGLPTEMLPMDRLTAPLGQGPEVASPPREDLYGVGPEPPASGTSLLLEPVGLPPGDGPGEPPAELPAGPRESADALETEPLDVEPAAELPSAFEAEPLDLEPAATLPSAFETEPAEEESGPDLLEQAQAATEEPAPSPPEPTAEPVLPEIPELGLGAEESEPESGAAPWPGLPDLEPPLPAADAAHLEPPGIELSSDALPEIEFPDAGLAPAEPGGEAPVAAEPPTEEALEEAAPVAGDEPTEELPIVPSTAEEAAEPPAIDAVATGLEPLDLEVPMPATPELETPAVVEPDAEVIPGAWELEPEAAEPLAAEPEAAELLETAAPGRGADLLPSAAEPAAPSAAESVPPDPFTLEPAEVEPPDLSSLPPPLPGSRGPRAEEMASPSGDAGAAPATARGGVVFTVPGESPFHAEWTEGEKARAEQAFAHEGLFAPGAGAAATAGALLAGGLAAARAEALPATEPAAEPAPPPVPETTAEPSEEIGATVTLARLYQRQGHRDEARRAYREVLARNPEDEEARRGLAELEGAAGRLTAAELLAGVDGGLAGERKKILLLENYLRRLRGGTKGRPA